MNGGLFLILLEHERQRRAQRLESDKHSEPSTEEIVYALRLWIVGICAAMLVGFLISKGWLDAFMQVFD